MHCVQCTEGGLRWMFRPTRVNRISNFDQKSVLPLKVETLSRVSRNLYSISNVSKTRRILLRGELFFTANQKLNTVYLENLRYMPPPPDKKLKINNSCQKYETKTLNFLCSLFWKIFFTTTHFYFSNCYAFDLVKHWQKISRKAEIIILRSNKLLAWTWSND